MRETAITTNITVYKNETALIIENASLPTRKIIAMQNYSQLPLKIKLYWFHYPWKIKQGNRIEEASNLRTILY